VLNKQDFQDSIRLRYEWEIDGSPRICACGTKNSPYHALDCKLGGYVSMRHNSVRDTIAFFLREAKFRDVKVKPGMISVNASHYKRSTITQDDARLDVSAVGVYSSFEHSFLNIRVTHPNCASNEFKDLKHIYKSKKKSRKMHTKKGLYKQRKDHLCLSYLPHLEEWVHYAMNLSNNWWKNWRIIKTREQVS